jgi:multisubunit Na+/H+ antiporter MnhG subunit
LGGACTVVGCGIQDTTVAAILLALFALSTIAIPFVSIGLWRSASKYPRQTWSQTFLTIGAKLCAVVSGLLAVTGLTVLLYIGFYIFINPALGHA